jgi:transcriptional regulator with PAS, ATPase and Fis domain
VFVDERDGRELLLRGRNGIEYVTGNAGVDAAVVRSPAMARLYETAARAARTPVPILIRGETGSGKEHVAVTIHTKGTRCDGPFIVANCAAIPDSLMESTLFGYERGAFTGAAQRAAGLFEEAQGGVLFLDEIGELSHGAQAAVLRAIETKKVSRIGSNAQVVLDVQIVAATHRDLDSMVRQGSFREDLFYRLDGITLSVPPLRDRKEDIVPLIDVFLKRARDDHGARATALTSEALDALLSYSWPGNVRQLRHAIQRGAVLSDGAVLGIGVFRDLFRCNSGDDRDGRSGRGELALKERLKRHERALIEDALRRATGNRRLAAEFLRIPVRTLSRRMQACGVRNVAKPSPAAPPSEARFASSDWDERSPAIL